MKRNVKWTILFSLLALLLLTAIAGAAWDSGEPRPAIVVYSETAVPAEMEAALESLEGVTYLWSYDTFFSGAAIEADAAALRAIEKLDGISGADWVTIYERESTASSDAVTSEEGLALMGADTLWEQGYTGDGLVIAVIDSGLNVNHEAFADDSLVQSPSISSADVASFAQKGGTQGQYISSRIPFAYDYYSNDGDVSTTNQHGTHVTALAAGYARDASGEVTFRGAAPGAQILGMKIFPDGSGSGTNDSIILRALEDAWNLGADVVNISVGTGAGFSASDVIGGLYCRAFQQMSESGVIICCATGNSPAAVTYRTWGQPLPSGGYTDYSTVCSPSTLYGATAIGAASQSSGAMVMAEYSSWGPASGLHLTPALTGFGGPLQSASATDNAAYRSDGGTSMSSASMSGNFAALLQVLRQRGVTDKRQASSIALALIESTATLLTDAASGLPVSPRWQGAGYVNLAAAADSELLITDPLIELGESEDGSFELTLTLRNLTDRPITTTLKTQILTDDYKQQDGKFYSLMTPKDITSGVTAAGGGSVTVPANGEIPVTLRLTVTEQLRQELAKVYPNGFYVEGYVTATGGSRPVHGTFLGYCGDWEAAPVLETSDFRDVQNAEARLTGSSNAPRTPDAVKEADYLNALDANLGANLVYLASSRDADPKDGILLGSNAHIYATHNDVRSAIPAKGGEAAEAGGILNLRLYAQRSAAGVVLLVSNPDTKEVYYTASERLLEKSIAYSRASGIPYAASFNWDATNANGAPLPAGTKVRVDVYAWLDTDKDIETAYAGINPASAPGAYAFLLDSAYDQYRELSFPAVTDGSVPTAAAALNGSVLTLTLRDDNCVSYAQVLDANGNLLSERAYTPTSAGEACTLTVDFTGKALPDTVYIQVEDYATHKAAYSLDVKALASGQSVTPQRSTSSTLTDVTPTSWYREAVNFVLDRGIMEASGGTFLPNKAAIRSEIVTALYRASGSPPSSYAPGDLPFTDVSAHTSYADALCWAYEQKIVTGRDDGTFGGGMGVTRQEFTAMLYRCANLNGKPETSGSLAAFPDASSVSSWAVEAMSWAVGEGLIQGNDAKQLSPNAGVTRAETAQILMRFLSRE